MPGKVIIIAYEFPPSAGGGVQRPAKMARYLSDFGWEPIVIAAAPVEGRPRDDSLLHDVEGVRIIHTPARHVAVGVSRTLQNARGLRDRVLGRTPGAGKEPSASATAAAAPVAPASGAKQAGYGKKPQGRSQEITSWITVPDFATYWVGPAVAAAVAEGRRVGVDAIVATSPPFSTLVAGSRAAAKLGVPFVADFRDAWRDNPGAWYPTAWHRDRSLAAERATLARASHVLAVSQPIADETIEMGGPATTVVPNGFDPADIPAWNPDPDGPPRIAFMGRMYPAHSDPRPLFDGMLRGAEISSAASGLVFDIVGPEVDFVREAVAARGLGDRVIFHGYQPHLAALDIVSRADAGVVLIRDAPESKASYTGKIFEYLGMRIPILLAGYPQGVAFELLDEADAGIAVPHGDVEAIAQALVRIAEAKRAGDAIVDGPRDEVVARYDRRSQAGVLAGVLDEVTR